MNGKAIIYPYWENVARGYEDILAVITLAELLFLVYAAVLALVFFGIWWKHKGWTIRDKWLILKDKAERRMERIRAKRLAKKGHPEDLEFLTEFDAQKEKKPGWVKSHIRQRERKPGKGIGKEKAGKKPKKEAKKSRWMRLPEVDDLDDLD